MNVERLLARLLELVGDSDGYFVSGSLSFLPRLPPYREPQHDVDAAVEAELFRRISGRLAPHETLQVLTLPEVVLADRSILCRPLRARTSFIHLHTAAGLLDLAVYSATSAGLAFTLGPGLRLLLPNSVLDRVEMLRWKGIAFRAGPPELAFIPKALADRSARGAPHGSGRLPAHHRKDLRRLVSLLDAAFVSELARCGGLRLLGRRLPRWLDPFAGLASLAAEPADAAR